MDYTQVLLKPLISEKTTLLKDSASQITFIVDRRANKVDVRRAVEKAFKVKVRDVNVVVYKPGVKTKHGRVTGRVSGYKKAYVTLVEGEKIEFFEGV
jgi:large subunit ribosomal protein L23